MSSLFQNQDFAAWTIPPITVPNASSNRPGAVLKRSCAEWLEDYLLANELTCSTAGQWSKAGERLELPTLLKQIFADADRAGSSGFKFATISNHIGLIIANALKRRVDEVRQSVAFSGVNNALAEYTSIIFGPLEVNELAFRTACLAQFLWQVKRKLNGLPCNDPLMVVLQGAQGVGKSSAVSNLIRPFAGLYVASDVQKILDQRSYTMLAENFIVFLDELARADKSDVAALKGLLSGDVISGRPMGTNITDQRQNLSTFIATVQLPLQEVIRDPTGMRRFVELSLPKLATRQDGINKAIALTAFCDKFASLIWQGVDENASAPINSHRVELSKRQEQITGKSFTDDWLDAYELHEPTHFVPTKQLWLHHNDFLKSVGRGKFAITSIIEFGRKISEALEQQPKAKRFNGKQVKGFMVGKSVGDLMPDRYEVGHNYSEEEA